MKPPSPKATGSKSKSRCPRLVPVSIITLTTSLAALHPLKKTSQVASHVFSSTTSTSLTSTILTHPIFPCPSAYSTKKVSERSTNEVSRAILLMSRSSILSNTWRTTSSNSSPSVSKRRKPSKKTNNTYQILARTAGLKKDGSEDNRIAKAQIYLQRKVNAGDLASIATLDGNTWNGVARELKRASKVQINSFKWQEAGFGRREEG